MADFQDIFTMSIITDLDNDIVVQSIFEAKSGKFIFQLVWDNKTNKEGLPDKIILLQSEEAYEKPIEAFTEGKRFLENMRKDSA